jgi:hypothetical protein
VVSLHDGLAGLSVHQSAGAGFYAGGWGVDEEQCDDISSLPSSSVFRGEYSNAFSYDSYAVAVIEVPGTVPYLSGINPIESGLRGEREIAIATRKTDSNSVSELKTGARPAGDEVDSHSRGRRGCVPRALGRRALPYCIRIENWY